MINKIAVLPGDYIGPEIMEAGLSVLAAVTKGTTFEYRLNTLPFGGAAIDAGLTSLPHATLEACQKSDAILLAAIGGPKWDACADRPEMGLLAIREKLGLFANIRPTEITTNMAQYSPLKKVHNVNFMIVRELTSGIYFGQPRQLNSQFAVDTMKYASVEIERIAIKAFQLAQRRKQQVTLVDKANVLATSKLWRKTVARVAQAYPNIKYNQLYVDAASMQLISQPEVFDVILTENLFGDILSDEAAQITGSLGTIPSMSEGSTGPILYEPIHGSAPDIAGLGIANPLSMIKSVALMLEHSFAREDLSQQINRAINHTLRQGIVTPDLDGVATTTQMTDAIITDIFKQKASE